MARALEGSVRSDLSRCAPADRLSREPRDGCWRLVDYRTEDGIAGVMAFGDPARRPGEIVLPLEAEGVCRVYLGINYTRSPYGDTIHHVEWPLYGSVWARLSDDPGFSRFAAEIMWRHAERFTAKTGRELAMWTSVQETYWKTADVTGRSLVISMPGPPYDRPDMRQVANLSYVRLVPLAGQELAEWERRRDAPGTRRGALLWCSAMLTGHTSSNVPYHPVDLQWFRDELEPLAGSDIGILVFEAIRGSLCAYRTRLGDVGTADGEWSPGWLDPLECFTALAHERGMKLFASMRMIG